MGLFQKTNMIHVVIFPIAFVLITVPEESAFVLFPRVLSLQEGPTFSLLPELLGPRTRQVIEPTVHHDTIFNLLMFLAQHGALNLNKSSTQTLGKDLVIRAERSQANVVFLKNNEVVMTTEATSQELQETLTSDSNATKTEKTEELQEEEETEPASEPQLPFTTDESATTTTTVATTNGGSSMAPRGRKGAANLTEVEGERSTVSTTPTTTVSFSTEEPEEEEEEEAEEKEEEEAEEEEDLNPSASATPTNEAEEEADETILEQNFEPTTEKPEAEEVRSLTIGDAEESDVSSDEDKEEQRETPFVSLSFGRLECILMEGRCVRSCSDNDDIILSVACGSDKEGHGLVCCED